MARREGPGAPATGIQLRPDGAFAFGFGLERDSLSGVLVDLTGARLWQYERSLSPERRPPTRSTAWLRLCVLCCAALVSGMCGTAPGGWGSPLPGRSTWPKAP